MRNYEQLPTHAGMDVDVLCESPAEVARMARQTAESLGLFVIDEVARRAAKVLVLDLDDTPPDARRWVLLDLQSRYLWKGRVLLSATNIAALSEFRPHLGLRVLKPGAEFLLLSAHLVSRTAQKPRYRWRLRSLANEHERSIRAFLIARGARADSVRRWMAEIRDEASPVVARRSFATVAGDLLGRTSSTDRRALAKALLGDLRLLAPVRRLRAIARASRPGWLLAVLGPDGVGKTTLCTSLKSLLELYPVRVVCFHHIRGALEGSRKDRDARPKAFRLRTVKLWLREHLRRPAPDGPGIGAGIGRIAYDVSRVPYEAMRETYYASLFRRRVRRSVARPLLVISDRWYPFTRPASYAALEPARRWLFRLSRALGVGLADPDLCVLLRDDPRRIHERKTELSVDEIVRFQETEDRLLRASGARRSETAFIADPAALSRSLLRRIFAELGPRVFPLIDDYDRSRAAGEETT